MTDCTSKPRFSAAVISILVNGGWFENRKIELPHCDGLLGSARSILEEFGGLRLGRSGAGREFAASEIYISPDYVLLGRDQLLDEEKKIGHGLACIGDVDKGNADLIVDERGSVYFFFEDIYRIADTFDEALECILLGIRVNKAGQVRLCCDPPENAV